MRPACPSSPGCRAAGEAAARHCQAPPAHTTPAVRALLLSPLSPPRPCEAGASGAWELETALVRSSVTSVGNDDSNLAVLTFSDSVDTIVTGATRKQASPSCRWVEGDGWVAALGEVAVRCGGQGQRLAQAGVWACSR